MNAPDPREKGLVDRVRAGEAAALTTLYQRYGRQVYTVALRMTGSADEAQDIVQDVFVGLPEALRSYSGAGDLGAWLRRVAVRTALAYRRSERRRAHWQERAVDVRPGVTPPPAVEAKLTLERALARMPEDLRTVFVLKEMEGYSHGDVARLLGITVSASQVRLHRARAFLKQHLRDRL